MSIQQWREECWAVHTKYRNKSSINQSEWTLGITFIQRYSQEFVRLRYMRYTWKDIETKVFSKQIAHKVCLNIFLNNLKLQTYHYSMQNLLLLAMFSFGKLALFLQRHGNI